MHREYLKSDSIKPQQTFLSIINIILFYGFLLFAVFMPQDSLNIKKILFIAILFLNSRTIIPYILKYRYFYYTYYALIFPILIIIISYLRNNNLSSAISSAYICAYLLLIFIIYRYKLDYKKIFINILTLLAIALLLGTFLDIFRIISIYDNPLFIFLSSNNEAMIGKSTSYAFNYMIFFKASSLLIVLLAYALYNKKVILLLISLFAIYFSGTRANVYISAVIIIFYFYTCNRNIFLKFFVTFSLGILTALYSTEIYNFVENSFLIKASSDAVRLGHFYSILNYFSKDLLTVFIGMGFGSYFYSSGIGNYVNATELSYLELIRQVGIIGFIPFMYFVIKPLRKLFLIKEKRWLFLSYTGYLIIAFTNPFLFSSTAFLLYILVNLEDNTVL